MKPLETVYWWRLGFGILAAFLAVGFLIIAGAVNTNLVLNSSVEVANAGATAPQNWNSTGNGAQWSTAYARTGSRSLEINVNNANASWTGQVGQVSGGNVYHIEGFFYGQVVKDQFYLTISWFSNSGEIGDNSVTLPVANYAGWQLEGASFTAPSGAKSYEIVFSAVNASGDLYGDDFEVRQTEPVQSFLNSASIAILVYIVSYYVLKSRFGTKVAKPQKILTAGIGIYILAWLVVWTLLYTLVAAG
jgi:hypothetical protein